MSTVGFANHNQINKTLTLACFNIRFNCCVVNIIFRPFNITYLSDWENGWSLNKDTREYNRATPYTQEGHRPDVGASFRHTQDGVHEPLSQAVFKNFKSPPFLFLDTNPLAMVHPRLGWARVVKPSCVITDDPWTCSSHRKDFCCIWIHPSSFLFLGSCSLREPSRSVILVLVLAWPFLPSALAFFYSAANKH